MGYAQKLKISNLQNWKEKNQHEGEKQKHTTVLTLNTVKCTPGCRYYQSLCNCERGAPAQCFLSPSASLLHFLELFKFKGRTFLFDLSKQVI